MDFTGGGGYITGIAGLPLDYDHGRHRHRPFLPAQRHRTAAIHALVRAAPLPARLTIGAGVCRVLAWASAETFGWIEVGAGRTDLAPLAPRRVCPKPDVDLALG